MLNIFWFTVYKFNHPWIEQYKSLKNTTWPWEEADWNTRIWNGIKYFIINVFIMNPLCFLFSVYMNDWKLFLDMDPYGIPDKFTMAK